MEIELTTDHHWFTTQIALKMLVRYEILFFSSYKAFSGYESDIFKWDLKTLTVRYSFRGLVIYPSHGTNERKKYFHTALISFHVFQGS